MQLDPGLLKQQATELQDPQPFKITLSTGSVQGWVLSPLLYPAQRLDPALILSESLWTT